VSISTSPVTKIAPGWLSEALHTGVVKESDESRGTADKAFELKGIERKRPSVTKGAPSPHFGIGTSRQRKFHFPELTDFSATIPRNHLHLS
jgi:hypothetical protein